MYYSASKLISYGAIYNFIISNRNYGKTWCFKKRATRRAMKHGRKTIWVRRFTNEKKKCVDSFFQSDDLLEYCGLSWYSKDNKQGNLKQVGSTFYLRKGKKWQWFIKVIALSEHKSLRSVDDVKCDTIVFDEFSATPEQYRLYKGNEVTHFNDMFYSAKRKHILKCYFLGNKESVSNPYFSYFGIKPLPVSYEGIKKYKNGSIVIQQINNIQDNNSEYDKKVHALFNGTEYGNYLYNNDYKNNSRNIKYQKTPSEAALYVQLYWNGNPLKISSLNGYYYVNDKLDKTMRVYTDLISGKYKDEKQLVKKQKTFFTAYINALSDNRVRYSSAGVREAALYFHDWLGV